MRSFYSFFVEIGGIVVHYCLSFLFIKYLKNELHNGRSYYHTRHYLYTHIYIYIDLVLDLLCLAPPSAIFQRLVLVVEDAGVPADHGQATGILYHWWLRVECTIFCNLQSRARTYDELVIRLYELIGNPTT